MSFVRFKTPHHPQNHRTPTIDPTHPHTHPQHPTHPSSSRSQTILKRSSGLLRPTPGPSYAVRLAAWSQPPNPSSTSTSSQTGFRIGRGAFLPFNQNKAIHEAITESNEFIQRLSSISSPSSPTTSHSTSPPSLPPTLLNRPLAIPQSITALSTAPFLRSSTQSLHSGSTSIPLDLFTDFIDLLNALLLAGVGGCAVEDLMGMGSNHILSNHLHRSLTSPDHTSPPPGYIHRPKPIDQFLLVCNQYLFRPRRLECRIVTHLELRSRLGLPDRLSAQSLQDLSAQELLRLARSDLPSPPRPLNALPTELAHLTLPLRLTSLSQFPVRLSRARTLAQIYRPRPLPRRPSSGGGGGSRSPVASPVSPLLNPLDGSEDWTEWRKELEELVRSNWMARDPVYWLLIQNI